MVVAFFFNDPATTDIYTLSLHDALPISRRDGRAQRARLHRALRARDDVRPRAVRLHGEARRRDRKSTRLNSSHMSMSYAVFCLKKKNEDFALYVDRDLARPVAARPDSHDMVLFTSLIAHSSSTVVFRLWSLLFFLMIRPPPISTLFPYTTLFRSLAAMGAPNALACIALSERGTMFDPGPCVYMEKLAGGPGIADLLSLDEPLTDVIRKVAERKEVDPTDVRVIMLDRPRHEEQVAAIREVGSRIRFISDGDVSAALFAVSQGTGVDLLWGIGGTPEGVLSAAAIKCLGGELLGKLWPRDDEERRGEIDAGYDLDEALDANRLVVGEDVFFAATGVTDGDLLEGVRYLDDGHATTESLVMRSRSGTVRTVQARHDRPKLREITGGRYG